MQPGLISILIPLYNEDATVAEIVSRVLAANLPVGYRLEIVIVDDGSTDGSGAIAEDLQARDPDRIRLIRSPRNCGKGAAVRTAVSWARGEFCLIQDADLEYDPRDYRALLEPLVRGSADVVYGSRFTGSAGSPLYFWHSVANQWITRLCDFFSGLRLTDVLTGYKAFRTSLVKALPLRSDGFAIEPELTMKLAKRGARFCEVPVGYVGRSYREGKKVGFWDAFATVGVILACWAVDGEAKTVKAGGQAKAPTPP